jgi:hypothetical protein
VSEPCGCEKAKAIRDFAEAEGRRMRREEAIVALAADLEMDPAELKRRMLNQRALAAWRRQRAVA